MPVERPEFEFLYLYKLLGTLKQDKLTVSSFSDVKYVCGESEEKKAMFQKLLLAATITLTLYLFSGVRLSANNSSATKAYLTEIPTFSYPKDGV